MKRYYFFHCYIQGNSVSGVAFYRSILPKPDEAIARLMKDLTTKFRCQEVDIEVRQFNLVS